MLFYAVLATISAPVAHAQAEAPMLQAASLPLNVSRKVAFDTDEGSWISLDVSPDGRTIVFELLGDLYTLDARGGTAQLLLGGLAFETQPAFSPDGRQIAFLSDRSGSENLWIAAADGSNPRQLSRDDDNTAFASPAWSADGQTLYVSRGERPNQHNTVFYLWAYDVRGGGRTRLQRMLAPPECPSCPTAVLPALSDAAGHSALGVVPSADGRYLYFSSKAAGANRWQISCHDLETGEESAVVAIPGGAMKPVLSPDGRQLIYATRLDGQTGLRIRDLDSGTDRWLTYPVQTDASDYSVASRDLLPSSSFTPDGTALILNLDGKIQRLEIASGKSRPIPFTASVSLDVGPQLRAGQRVQDGPVRARVIQAPKQSPDARRVAFSALGQLYSMNLSNGKVRRVTDSIDAEFQPNWSPDGRQLTYVTWKAAGGGHVWRVSAEGGKPQRVSDYAAYYSDPVFAPDGKTIYALRSNNFERTQAHDEVSAVRAVDIVKISPSGKSEFVSRQAQIRNLHFTQDSSRIYFHSWDGSIRSVALDGTAGRVHVRIRGPGGKELQARTAAASNAAISPDGRWLLAQFGLAPQLYLIGVPQMGEGILEIDLQQPTVSIQRVTDSGADYFAWADDGKTITWALGPTFYRRSLSSIRLAPSSQPLADDAEGTQSFLVDLSIPRDLPRGALVLRGATVITMRGDEVIQDADIWIGDNRILNVGRRGSVAIPEHAQIRDIRGKFVVPGFIDTHAHWFEIRRDVLDLQHWSFIANLAYGVTSGLDPQAYTSDMFVYEDMLDAGRMIGVRAFSTGPGMMANTLLATG
ncbi:LpqB family beta-propeller domain-containing protein, partial [Steroidobacter sp.]|uniref:LpqB family beta-propeller domain-containing protein n=1 Tax=Steroidobacter sp. TaxID=1978227 RepID=UPI001A482BF5